MDKSDNRLAKVYFEQDYRDRGKIKWNGFFLSDHTLAIHRHQLNRYHVQPKEPAMSIVQLRQVVYQVWQDQRLLVLQPNMQDHEGQLLPAQTGFVESFDTDGVRLAGQVYAWPEILTVRQE